MTCALPGQAATVLPANAALQSVLLVYVHCTAEAEEVACCQPAFPIWRGRGRERLACLLQLEVLNTLERNDPNGIK